jgi:hypothetical protein
MNQMAGYESLSSHWILISLHFLALLKHTGILEKLMQERRTEC